MTRSREQIRWALEKRAEFAEANRQQLAIMRLERRLRYLPSAIETTRAKLARLEAEAASLGLHDIIEERP